VSRKLFVLAKAASSMFSRGSPVYSCMDRVLPWADNSNSAGKEIIPPFMEREV
jgi:hypothetical protein